MTDLQELIKKIEMNKHDIVMRVRAVVKDPIAYMNRKDAATQTYFQEQKKENDKIIQMSDSIMLVFAEKWRNVKSSESEQLQQMMDMIKKVTSDIIPQIKTVVSFYDACVKKSYYFSSTNAGDSAKKKFSMAIKMADVVCRDLMTLEDVDTEESRKSNNLQPFNLLLALQEVLDDIEADVKYEDEYDFSLIDVLGNRKEFVDHVLLNIKENVNKHAFGTSSRKKKHIWEKKVYVKVTQDDNHCFVSISNNGESFTGREDKIFEYGYCYGEKKCNGIGMHSAREHMRAMNGDLEFKTMKSGQYRVTHLITLPK